MLLKLIGVIGVSLLSSALIAGVPDASWVKPDNSTLSSILSKEAYYVTQEEGTERPFKNEYWDNKEHGLYVDIVSGEVLFASIHKYKSGTGWPSFSQPVNDKALTLHKDRQFFRVRTEIKSKLAGSHLGHVFNDAPKELGGISNFLKAGL